MGQSVLTDHFNAQTYLQRDVTNIARYFGKLNIPVNEEEMMSIIKRKEDEEK
jgi:serine/threonine-protein kinase RIO1